MYFSYRVLHNITKINVLSFKLLQSTFSKGTRCISQLPFNSNYTYRNQSTKEIQWTPIYRFPLIQGARMLNRFKLYQTLVTGLMIPITSVLCHYSITDFSVVKIFLGCGIVACVTLYPMTWFLRRLIGVIYVSEDDQLVKISHLTFWGNRKDIVVPTENIIPLTDCEYNISDLYVKLQRSDVNDVLHFTLKYGKILEEEKFKTVFGDIALLGFFKNKR